MNDTQTGAAMAVAADGRLVRVLSRLCRGHTLVVETQPGGLAAALHEHGVDRVSTVHEDAPQGLPAGDVAAAEPPALVNVPVDSAKTVVLASALPVDPEAAARLLALAWARVRSGGRLVVVAPNRKALEAPGALRRRQLQHLLQPLGRPKLSVNQPYRWLVQFVRKPRVGDGQIPVTVAERYRSVAELCRGSVLELGCGPGHLAAAIAAHGCDVVGMDLNYAKVRDAQRRYPHVRFFQGDAARLDTGGRRFDTVVIAEVLEHVSADVGANILSAGTRALRGGGRLIVSVPNEKSIPHPNHVRTFDVQALRLLLRPFGRPRQVIDQPYKWLLMYVDLDH